MSAVCQFVRSFARLILPQLSGFDQLIFKRCFSRPLVGGKELVRPMEITCTGLACSILGLSLLVPLSSAVSDDPTPLTHEERNTLEARLLELSNLPLSEVADSDRWADADVYRKSAQWALREQMTFTAADRQLIAAALDDGLRRSRQLRESTATWAQQRGPVVRGYVSQIDGSTQPFGVMIPQSYDGSRPMRLDVVLHGSTRPVGMSELRFMARFEPTTLSFEKDYIELHPLGRVENCYRWAGETDVFEAIEATCRQYNIDRKRIVLRGMSMGASGTWHLGLKHPDRFAALGPYCGYVDTHRFSETELPNFIKVPPLSPHQELGLHILDSVDYAANAAVVPVVAAIGDKDIFFDAHVLMGKAFSREGLAFTNLIAAGTGHVIDPVTHADQLDRIAVFAKQGVRQPEQIRFVTWTLKYPKCHWITVQGLDRHYHRAEVVAEIDSSGCLRVSRSDNVNRFTVDLNALPRPLTALRVHDAAIELHPTDGKLELAREGVTWQQVSTISPTRMGSKRPGVQGPIDDAFCSPFVCVRGTGTAWNSRSNDWANAELDAFAVEWRRYFRGELPIKRDVDLQPTDLENKNLILFGDPGSNAWIAKVLPHMPLRWDRESIQSGSLNVSSANHVPALIYPNPLSTHGDRYVVINSGHSFHEAELNAVNYLLFPRLGDWAVIRTDAPRRTDPRIFNDPSVISAGFFTEQWEIE